MPTRRGPVPRHEHRDRPRRHVNVPVARRRDRAHHRVAAAGLHRVQRVAAPGERRPRSGVVAAGEALKTTTTPSSRGRDRGPRGRRSPSRSRPASGPGPPRGKLTRSWIEPRAAEPEQRRGEADPQQLVGARVRGPDVGRRRLERRVGEQRPHVSPTWPRCRRAGGRPEPNVDSRAGPVDPVEPVAGVEAVAVERLGAQQVAARVPERRALRRARSWPARACSCARGRPSRVPRGSL